MEIEKIDLADFDLVEVKTTNECRPTPHCKLHGAMNKLRVGNGGIWRCLTVHGIKKTKVGNVISKKEIDTVCRAGCFEVPTADGLWNLPIKNSP